MAIAADGLVLIGTLIKPNIRNIQSNQWLANIYDNMENLTANGIVVCIFLVSVPCLPEKSS